MTPIKNGSLIAAVAILSALLSLAYLDTCGDDSFIYFRLIENFLRTGQIEYNPGEPCYAMTSATFFAFFSLLARGFGLDGARYVLSPLSHLLAVWALFGLGRRLIRNQALLAVVLAAVFFDPFYLRWFWAGWEMSFKVGAAALALWALLEAGGRGGWRWGAVAGLAMAFAVLTRPEMLFLAGLGAAYLLVRPLPAPLSRSGTLLAGYAGALAAGALPWMLFAKSYFGWTLPHTVYAKAGGLATWGYLREFLPKFMQILFVPALPLYVWAVAAVCVVLARGSWRTGRSLEEKRDLRDVLLVAVWAATAAGYLIRGVYVDGIKLGLFSPFAVLSAGAVLDLARRLGNKGGSARAARVWIGALLLLSVGIQARLFYRFSSWHARYAGGDDANLIAFAKRVKELTPPDARIGIDELGVIGYFSGRYMIDYVGLATPQLVAYQLETGSKEAAVARYYERHGGPASHVVREFRFNPERAPVQCDFWGYPYRLVDSARVTRIAGRAKKGEYSIYALYEQAP